LLLPSSFLNIYTYSLSTTLISLADSAVAAAAGVGGRHANCYSDQDSSTTTVIIIFPE
jgi:hypothetical protein